MSDLETILNPATIRKRTRRIFDAALSGKTAFRVHPEKLGAVIDFVVEVTNRNYPDGKIPYHGRYEHFRAGGIDRVAQLQEKLRAVPPIERAGALVDLVLISVLLDAGAGNAWTFMENGVGYPRSEGLALASLDMFSKGAFSDDPAKPLQATARGLAQITVEKISHGFQVSKTNPLAGLDGRVSLLKNLATSMKAFPQYFGEGNPRPAGMVSALLATAKNGEIRAVNLLRMLLLGLSQMWPARVTCEGVGFGDVWPYGNKTPEDWVPFHKLSQWLAYSLIEPIESAGVRVTGVDELTGLPEYRNGGLFLDFGVLELRDPSLALRPLEAGEPAVIEWRALTVQLLDMVGEKVCERLGKTKAELPLARVLQGGTWSAGREIAKKLRDGGVPPLQLKSDGMVF